jgi:hypothetical protein
MNRSKFIKTGSFWGIYLFSIIKIIAQNSDTLATKPTALIYENPISVRYICSDISLNAYVISQKNEILSFDWQGKSIGKYSNDRLGQAAKIDASNPSSIVIWYPDFHTIVWLDVSLTETARLDLRKIDLANVQTLAAGSDQSLWVYDDQNFQLKNVNSQGKIQFSSQFLNQAIGQVPKPTGLQEFDQQIFMGDSTVGFYVFDKFGQYQKTIPAAIVHDFQVADNKLRYFDDGLVKEIFTKNPSLKRAIAVPNQVQKTDTIFIQKRRIYVIRPEKYEVWLLGLQ